MDAEHWQLLFNGCSQKSFFLSRSGSAKKFANNLVFTGFVSIGNLTPTRFSVAAISDSFQKSEQQSVVREKEFVGLSHQGPVL